MTLDDLVAATLDREGRVYRAPPGIDQPTAPGGVTLPALTAYRGHPCTVADLEAFTVDDAVGYIQARFQNDLSRLRFDQITYEPLRVQLLDFGYESGEARAVRWLQRVLGLAGPALTGVVDARTLLQLSKLPFTLVNNALAGARAHAAYHGAVPQQNLQAGVAHRAIEFVVALDEPPGTE